MFYLSPCPLRARQAQQRKNPNPWQSMDSVIFSDHCTIYEELGALAVFPPVLGRVQALMAAHAAAQPDDSAAQVAALPTFSFHHQHALVSRAGAPAATWHHDYEQYPQSNRDLLMVHCFYCEWRTSHVLCCWAGHSTARSNGYKSMSLAISSLPASSHITDT